LALAGAVAAGAQSAPFISEIYVNIPGVDDGFEALEFTAPANFNFSSNGGWYLLCIEGNEPAANTGEVDNIIDLTGASAGSNGILLVRDDMTNVHQPAPPAQTNIIERGAEMNPDIENGAATYVLGYGTKPPLKYDFDTDNNGTVDQTPAGFTIVDAVSWADDASNVKSGWGYGDQLGGTDFGHCMKPPVDGFTPDAAYRVIGCDGNPAGWVVIDTEDRGGGGLGPWGVQLDGTGYQEIGLDTFGFDVETFTLDLGHPNIVVCEGPITLAPTAYTLGPQGSEEGANDVAKVQTSDDVRAVAFNTTVANNNIPSIRFTFFFTSPVTTGITELKATVEHQSQFANHEVRIEFVNASNNNAFFQVDSMVQGTPNADVTRSGSLTNAGDIAAVVAGDGTVKTTARGRKVGVMPAQKHRLRVDMAKLEVSQ